MADKEQQSAILQKEEEIEGELENELLGDSPGDKLGHDKFTITSRDWQLMRAQNERILEELAQLRTASQSKRKRKSDSDKKEIEKVGKTLTGKSTAQNKKKICQKSDADKSTADSAFRESKKQKRDSESEGEIHSDYDPDDLIQQMVAEKDDEEEDMVTELSVLDDIEQELEQDTEVGPPINDQLAKVLKTMAKGRMDEDKLKAKMEMHKRPTNCDQPTVPKVNPEIWGILDNNTKTADLRLQRRQKILLKAVYAATAACDTCVRSDSPAMKKLVKNMTDTISLNLKVVHDLSLERRSKILNSPTVNKKYRKMPADVPVTDYLFGNDLKAVLSSIESTHKLGQNFVQSTRGRKFFPKNGMWVDGWRPYRGQNWGRPRGRGPRARGRWPQRPMRGAQAQ